MASTPTLETVRLGAPTIKAGQTQGYGLHWSRITSDNFFSISPYTSSSVSKLKVNWFGRQTSADGTVIGIAQVTNDGTEDVALSFEVMADVSGQDASTDSADASVVLL